MTVRRFLLSFFLLAFFAGLQVCAQNGYVVGEVSDAYMQEGLAGVEAALLRDDSTVVVKGESKLQTVRTTDTRGNVSVMVDRYAGAAFRLPVPAEGAYILRLSKKGYETKYLNLALRWERNSRTYDAGGIVLFPMSRRLGEATVQATRIKMYHKGDTLIYNADAFQTAAGSMLDDLVRLLPGVEFRDGRLYAQGKFVESITISGKDFFNGDPNAALRNLPAYVVSKLKFYDKRGEKSQTLGRDLLDDKAYVMDVHLKREYQGTWLINPSVGYGTHDRYEGMLYLMRFDERQYFTLSADVNNIGQVRERTDIGTIVDADNDRELKNQYVKASYFIAPNKKFRFSVGGGYKHQSYRMETETATESYLQTGNLFTRSVAGSKTGLTDVRGDLMASLRPRKGLFVKFDYAATCNKRHLDGWERAALFSANPDDLMGGSALDSAFRSPIPVGLAPYLTYRLSQTQLENSHKFNQQARAEAHFALGASLLRLTFNWDRNHERLERMEHYDLRYLRRTAQDADDYRNRYDDLTNDARTYRAGAELTRHYGAADAVNGQFTASYQYDHRYESRLNPLYRLDFLQGWGADGGQALGMLPSTRDSLLQSLDRPNSYDWRTRTNAHQLALQWTHQWALADSTWMRFCARLPVTYRHRSLSYNRGGADYPVRTHSWLAAPTLTYAYMPVRGDKDGARSRWSLSYALEMTEPTLLLLPALRDDKDPLNVSLGNSGLKNTLLHRLTLGYRHYDAKRFRTLEVKANYNAWQDAVAMESVYDLQTGVRTNRPVNVGGNYATDASLSLSLPLDRAKKVYLSNSIDGRFSRAADLNRTENAVSSTERSEVKRAGASDYLGFTFSPVSQWRLSVRGNAAWDRVFSRSEGFTTLNVYEFGGLFELHAGLPWGVNLDSDFSVRKRYGYSNATYDRLEYLWNASLSRSWFKDRLDVKVELYDLLHSQRRIFSELNAWGRMEQYTRLYTPPYVMLHLNYRLTLTRKKKA